VRRRRHSEEETVLPTSVRSTDAVAPDLEHLRAELASIDETITGNPHSTLERAELLAARKRIYETMTPGSRRGGAPGRAGGGKSPRREADGSPVRSHAADVASRTGLSERSIRQLVQIAEGIPAPLRELIRGTPLAGRQRLLVEVARARRDPEEQRRRVAAALTQAPCLPRGEPR
jgi:ParB family transcriptional regulator, chromosome partitioning protein